MLLRDMTMDVRALEVEDSGGGRKPSGIVQIQVTSRYTASQAEANRMVELFNRGGWPLDPEFLDALNYGDVGHASRT